MSFKAILGDIIPTYLDLTKTEGKVLRTLSETGPANAYSVWKASKLKHYPTVLRTLKKLERKRLVDLLARKGVRGERIFTPTIIGSLVYYVFDRKEENIVELIKEKSRLYRALQKVDKDPSWAFVVARDVISDTLTKRKRKTVDIDFDDVLEDHMVGYIVDRITDGSQNREDEAVKDLMNMSRIDWVREIAIREVKIERANLEIATKILDKIAKDLDEKVRT